LKTYEGYLLVKESKNHSGRKTPLTIDCENETELSAEIRRITKAFMDDGNYDVEIKVSERW
jgi:hypothetical protein